VFHGAKNVIAGQIRKGRKRRLMAEGGAPARWYDEVYSGAATEYTVHYSDSRYLPVWESICKRVPKGARVLEVGCGPAQLAQMMLDRGILSDYAGFDFSSAAIELARMNLPGRRLEVDDARTTHLFTSVDYDTVICTEVLEHIVEDLSILERIPHGKQVLATVPDFDYVSHVRFFTDAREVRARYGDLFSSLDISEHHHAGDTDGSRGTFFLLNGVR